MLNPWFANMQYHSFDVICAFFVRTLNHAQVQFADVTKTFKKLVPVCEQAHGTAQKQQTRASKQEEKRRSTPTRTDPGLSVRTGPAGARSGSATQQRWLELETTGRGAADGAGGGRCQTPDRADSGTGGGKKKDWFEFQIKGIINAN